MNFKIRLFGLLTICIGLSCGTLGGIGPTLYFPTSKIKLEQAFSRLYVEHPEYNVPENWKKYDTWSERGYDFLEGRIFYFKTPPEEMYYVSFIGDSADLADPNQIGIAIRAIYTNEKSKWLLGDELSNREKDRITNRFNKNIISKLEGYTKSKASEEF